MNTNARLQSSPLSRRVEGPTLALVPLPFHPLLLSEVPARVGQFVGRADGEGRLMVVIKIVGIVLVWETKWSAGAMWSPPFVVYD